MPGKHYREKKTYKKQNDTTQPHGFGFLVLSRFSSFPSKVAKASRKQKNNKQNDTPQPPRSFPPHGFVFVFSRFFKFFLFIFAGMGDFGRHCESQLQMIVFCATSVCCRIYYLSCKRFVRECTTCVKMTVFARCQGRPFCRSFYVDPRIHRKKQDLQFPEG